jgi:hypothetical protein
MWHRVNSVVAFLVQVAGVKVHAVIDRGLTSLISRYTFNDTQ